jgi:2,3-dihydroxy-2,3-dihydrophenylpropionate dehydrogenase
VSTPLSSRTVLVTGGGSGIGRAAAEAYLTAGARVTVLERSEQNARRLAEQYGDAVQVVVGDATDPEALARAVDAAGVRGRLDHLTCCVGVFDGYASVRDLTPDQLRQAAGEIWAANVASVLLAVNCAYPVLREARGSVTITLSESAFRPGGGGVLYGSSKWALRGVVAHLSHDLAPEVRVNGVAPGGTTDTGLAGLSSLGQGDASARAAERDERIRAANVLGVLPTPADHAGAYLFLADPDASRVCTGVIIRTDGGPG